MLVYYIILYPQQYEDISMKIEFSFIVKAILHGGYLIKLATIDFAEISTLALMK